MKPSILHSFFAALLFPLLLTANDWPGWRGPNGDGKLPESSSYPTKWSSSENLLWKIALPAPGNSSPIVSGDHLFLTLAEDSGHLRSLLCFDTKTGNLKWKKSVKYEKDEITHRTNPWSAASPVTDGKTVFAWHGNAGLFAYDFEGNELWHRDLGSDYEHQWGPNAASPVIHGGNLIIHAGPGTEVALFSLDLADGKTVWETPLPAAESGSIKEFKGSWATPFIFDNDGRSEMVIGLPQAIRSFDPSTGKERWRCNGLSDLCYTDALAGAGHLVYLCGYGGPGVGMKIPSSSAVGDITESHRAWMVGAKKGNGPKNPQRIGSGQIVGDYLYLLNEPGSAECIKVSTGESQWKERLGRKSWSSMNYVGGKLYVNDQSGTTFVLDPDPSAMKLLATNRLDPKQHTNATPAFANGRIFLRTDAFLYGVAE